VWQSGRMMFSVLVEVQLRPGIADPQGSTIERSLPALGFGGVSEVHVGKALRFNLDAADAAAAHAQATEMCARFLTNPVIEDAVVTVVAGAAS
jgi:phosphoribosylformylglycinamidine synthase subunit PurS